MRYFVTFNAPAGIELSALTAAIRGANCDSSLNSILAPFSTKSLAIFKSPLIAGSNKEFPPSPLIAVLRSVPYSIKLFTSSQSKLDVAYSNSSDSFPIFFPPKISLITSATIYALNPICQ